MSGEPLSGAAAARRLLPAREQHPALDQLAELAALLLDAPSAQVSLLEDEQVVAGAHGAAEPSGTRNPLSASLCTATARGEGPLVVPDAQHDARVAGLPPVVTGAVGSYLGVPLRDRAGAVVGALCVFGARSRAWSAMETQVLERLGRAVSQELELGAAARSLDLDRERWGLAVEAAGIGNFDWDLATGDLVWDARLLEVFDYAPGTFPGRIEGLYERVHPEDVERVREALHTSIERCAEFRSQYRLLLPDGSTRWVVARGRTLCDSAGHAVRLLGSAYDNTVVHDSEARVVRVLESMPAAFYALDRTWRFTYVNGEAERLLGRGREELLGGVIWDLFPHTRGTQFERNYRAAAESGASRVFEAYYPPPLDGWYELRVLPGADGLSVYFTDVTDQRAVRQEADRSGRRLGLLADVATALATLDAEEAMARLARLVVPELGTWCITSTLESDGRTLRDVGWWHGDARQRAVLDEYAPLRLPSLDDAGPARRALAQGRTFVLRQAATEVVGGALREQEPRRLLQELAPQSAVFVPVQASGRTLGLLSVFGDDPAVHADPATVMALEDLASRAGLALDNARAYAQQRDVAESLQRVLLTEPPQPGGLEIAVRYQPSSQAAQVGGDWYDAFVQRNGSTVVVIGDVVGHDTQAAAAMGQLRSLLRGVAVRSSGTPATALEGLDEAVELLGLDITATAVVARLEQGSASDPCQEHRLRWSNAGHPPPVVLLPGGDVLVLDRLDGELLPPDLLLGIAPGLPRRDHSVLLPSGATVLLYTDGLIERRGQDLEAGLEHLVDALRALAGVPLEQLCDEVLTGVPFRGEDDVALTAVRVP